MTWTNPSRRRSTRASTVITSNASKRNAARTNTRHGRTRRSRKSSGRKTLPPADTGIESVLRSRERRLAVGGTAGYNHPQPTAHPFPKEHSMHLRFPLALLCCVAVVTGARAQDDAKKATAKYVQKLQQKNGGFLPAAQNPTSSKAALPTLRAT